MCWNWIELCVLIVIKNNVVCLFQKWISELESSYRFKRRWAEGYGSQLEELEMFPRMWRFRQSRMLKLRRAGVKSGFTASKRNQWPACPWWIWCLVGWDLPQRLIMGIFILLKILPHSDEHLALLHYFAVLRKPLCQLSRLMKNLLQDRAICWGLLSQSKL